MNSPCQRTGTASAAIALPASMTDAMSSLFIVSPLIRFCGLGFPDITFGKGIKVRRRRLGLCNLYRWRFKALMCVGLKAPERAAPAIARRTAAHSSYTASLNN
jgi:hypothetical protein